MTQWFDKRLAQVDRERDYDKLRDLTKHMSQWAETLATCIWQLTDKPDDPDLRAKCKRIFTTYVVNEDVNTIETTASEHVRTPEGHIDNCSLANGAPEQHCQICKGDCPDREKY